MSVLLIISQWLPMATVCSKYDWYMLQPLIYYLPCVTWPPVHLYCRWDALQLLFFIDDIVYFTLASLTNTHSPIWILRFVLELMLLPDSRSSVKYSSWNHLQKSPIICVIYHALWSCFLLLAGQFCCRIYGLVGVFPVLGGMTL